MHDSVLSYGTKIAFNPVFRIKTSSLLHYKMRRFYGRRPILLQKASTLFAYLIH